MTDPWARLLGSALTESDVARLLGLPVLEIAADPGLLRLTNPDGQRVYPALQFDGRGPLPGLAQILGLLDGPLLPLTIASWLVTPQADLGGCTPEQALRDGDATLVLLVARQAAAAVG